MPKYYSLDLRQKAILMVNKGKSVRAVAKELDIGKSTIYEWLERDKNNDLILHKSGHKHSWKVNQLQVLEYLDLNKDAYLREIAIEFNLTPSGVYRILAKNRITRKKNYTLPTKRSKSEIRISPDDNANS